MAEKTAAVRAEAVDVPIERNSVLRPLAEAVSVIGTERMIKVGIAANATVVPSAQMPAPTSTSTREPRKRLRVTKPSAITTEPPMSAARGP